MEHPLPPPPHPVRKPGFVGALTHAWHGLVWATAHQRNMKIHVVAATLVACVGSAIRLGLPEKVTLIFCVLLVFFAEMVNTALEALVDLHIEEFHDLARVVKDTAAAGVLVLSIGTAALFAFILVQDWPVIQAHPREVIRQLAVGTPLAAAGSQLTAKWPRAKMVDAAILALAIGLLVALASWTTSPIFTAMIAGLLVLQAAAAYELRWRVGGP
jgi:diacylglycerol kinase (ATP)